MNQSAVGPQSQLLHAAIDAGIARGALDETIRLVKTYARPSIDRASDKASGNPCMIATIGGSVISSRRRRRTATS